MSLQSFIFGGKKRIETWGNNCSLFTMKKQITILFFILVLWMSSCDIFNQNDFIEREKITEIGKMILIYDLYQTGIDNYRYEFKLIAGQDTTHLFESYLNDATANNSQFSIEKGHNEIRLKINKPIGIQEKEASGITFKLEGIK